MMQIGVRIPHTGAEAAPDLIRTWCIEAERLDFDSLWGVDHVVMPHTVDSMYLLARKPAPIADGAVSELLSPNFELMTSLAFVAAITERIRLGTSVAVLPIRNAILNARQLATIDRYSGGRLVIGVGAGWLKEEADAMGMPWDQRGARTEEHIGLMRTFWTAEGNSVEFHGSFHDIPPMDPEPRPAQRPIPILIGGHSEIAIDRAARIGDGWIAAGMSSDRIKDLQPTLQEALGRHDRAASDLPIYCTARLDEATLDGLRAYQACGVSSLQLPFTALNELRRFAEEVLAPFRQNSAA